MSYIRNFQDGSVIHNQSGRPSSTNSTNTSSRAVPKVCLPKPECPTIDIQQRGTTEQLIGGLDRVLHSRARSKAAPDAEQLIDALDRVLESCACSEAAAAAADQQDETVLCAVCYTDDVSDLIQLKCGHTYHKDCLETMLAARWPGKRISFGYMCCPECRDPIEHPALHEVLEPHNQLKSKIEALCIAKCHADGYAEGELAEMFESDETAAGRACMDMLACYPCSSCREPFTAGRVDCSEDDQVDIDTIKCQECSFADNAAPLSRKEAERRIEELRVKRKDGQLTDAEYQGQQAEIQSAIDSTEWLHKCHEHGYEFAVYKCDSCCSIATFDCRC